MELKLIIYRIIMAMGVVSFCFSLQVNYFPTGFICIVSGIFTAIYLWKELMSSEPSRNIGRYDEPSVADAFDPIFDYRRNPEMAKLWLFLILPFVVWHIMSFGIGYAVHSAVSRTVVKEFVVSPFVETARRGHPKKAMRIKNMKTYALFGISMPDDEYNRIRNMQNVKVEIDSKESIFGLSFSNHFKLKSIKE